MKILFRCLVVLLLAISCADAGKRTREYDHLDVGNTLPPCTNGKQFIIVDDVFEARGVYIKGVQEYVETAGSPDSNERPKRKARISPRDDRPATTSSHDKSSLLPSSSHKEIQKTDLLPTPYVVKVDMQTNTDYEVNFLATIGAKVGFPKFIGCGSMPPQYSNGTHGFYVMTRLGPNLRSIYKLLNDNFNIDTVLGIGADTVERLKTMHDEKFIHEDIKLENMCIGGTEETKDVLHFIDFEFAEKLVKNTDNDYFFTVQKSQGLGTSLYMSRAALREERLCAADDLENLAYVLLDYGAENPFEWEHLNQDLLENAKSKDVFWDKPETMEKILGDKGKKLLPFLHAVNGLKPGHPIDYDHLKSTLTKPRTNMSWDWSHLTYSEIVEKTKLKK